MKVKMHQVASDCEILCFEFKFVRSQMLILETKCKLCFAYKIKNVTFAQKYECREYEQSSKCQSLKT